MKIIQALSELFLQLFKNKKGSNEHTHTHSQRHPNDRKCLDTQACTEYQNRDQGDASNMSKNAKTVSKSLRVGERDRTDFLSQPSEGNKSC